MPYKYYRVQAFVPLVRVKYSTAEVRESRRELHHNHEKHCEEDVVLWSQGLPVVAGRTPGRPRAGVRREGRRHPLRVRDGGQLPQPPTLREPAPSVRGGVRVLLPGRPQDRLRDRPLPVRRPPAGDKQPLGPLHGTLRSRVQVLRQ